LIASTVSSVASDLVSTEEAARALGVSPRTLTRYVAAGRITPAVVLTGGLRNHYRWDIDDTREQLRKLAHRGD
jgi:DNA-binding transcriptional MerR regulator